MAGADELKLWELVLWFFIFSAESAYMNYTTNDWIYILIPCQYTAGIIYNHTRKVI